MKEEQNTLEYQEPMKVDAENTSKNKQKWIPIYKVIDTSFFLETTNSPPEFLDQC